MRIFCNICFRGIDKETNRGLLASCCHVVCNKCLSDSRNGAGLLRKNNEGSNAVTTAETASDRQTIICPKCQKRGAAIAINRNLNPKLQVLFADPRPMLQRLRKAYRFQLMQLWAYNSHARKLQQKRERHLQKLQAAKVASIERAGMLRQLRPRITLLRTELRNKMTCFVQAIRRGEPLAEVRSIYESAQRTFER